MHRPRTPSGPAPRWTSGVRGSPRGSPPRAGDHADLSAVSALAAAVILGAQAVVFAIGALRGPRRHPYGLVFANLVAPRLGPVTEREPVPPLKFAQLVGFVSPSSASSGSPAAFCCSG